MSFPKLLLFLTLILFGVIGGMAWWKHKGGSKETFFLQGQKDVEIELEPEIAEPSIKDRPRPSTPLNTVTSSTSSGLGSADVTTSQWPIQDEEEESVDRIEELFNTDSVKLPIVETVTYHSRVPWLEERPAWISDYAAYYGTSKHFIARSLNHKPDYFSQKVSAGDRFNVFRKDKEIQFYLLVDLSRCKMRFYYFEGKEPFLLKTYRVGLGRFCTKGASGSLTPIGKYTLGNRVAIYKKGVMGNFNHQSTEMIRVFGTRWIPFEKELMNCSAPAKGYGLHGAPWIEDGAGQLMEARSSIGQYDSDGCIRLSQSDIEELFAIIITKPTTIEIVKDFRDASFTPQ